MNDISRQLLVTTPAQAGEILSRRRRALGLSQRELAAKLGISQARLSSLEAEPARLGLGRLLALANLLGFDLVLRDKSAASAEW